MNDQEKADFERYVELTHKERAIMVEMHRMNLRQWFFGGVIAGMTIMIVIRVVFCLLEL